MAKEDARFRNLQPEFVERLSLAEVRLAVLQNFQEALAKKQIELNIVGDVDVRVLEQLSRVYLGDIHRIGEGAEEAKRRDVSAKARATAERREKRKEEEEESGGEGEEKETGVSAKEKEEERRTGLQKKKGAEERYGAARSGVEIAAKEGTAEEDEKQQKRRDWRGRRAGEEATEVDGKTEEEEEAKKEPLVADEEKEEEAPPSEKRVLGVYVHRKKEVQQATVPPEERKRPLEQEQLMRKEEFNAIMKKQVESPFLLTSLGAVSCASPFVRRSQTPYATSRETWPAATASAAAAADPAAAVSAPAAGAAEVGSVCAGGKKERLRGSGARQEEESVWRGGDSSRRERQQIRRGRDPSAERAAAAKGTSVYSLDGAHAARKQKRIHVHIIDSDERAVVHIAGPAPNRWGICADGRNAWEPFPHICCFYHQQQQQQHPEAKLLSQHEQQQQQQEGKLLLHQEQQQQEQRQMEGEEDIPFRTSGQGAAAGEEQGQRQQAIREAELADAYRRWPPEETGEDFDNYDGTVEKWEENEQWAWQEARRRHPAFGRAALWLLQELVSKRMFSVLREEQRLTYDASFEFMSFEILFGGVFVVTIHTEPRLVAAVAAAARRALTELVSTRPLQEYQLESAKKQILSRHNHDIKFARYWMELLVGLQLDELPMKNIAYIRDMQHVVESITLDDMQQLLNALEIRPDTLWEAVGTSGPTPPPEVLFSDNKPKISVAAALRES